MKNVQSIHMHGSRLLLLTVRIQYYAICLTPARNDARQEKCCSPRKKCQVTKVKTVFSFPGMGRSVYGAAGIISPWLYFMSMGSVFCCHIEDYAFGSANVILAPPGSHVWAIWYSVPRRDIGNLHEYLRNLLGSEYTLDCLEQRKLWLDPHH